MTLAPPLTFLAPPPVFKRAQLTQFLVGLRVGTVLMCDRDEYAPHENGGLWAITRLSARGFICRNNLGEHKTVRLPEGMYGFTSVTPLSVEFRVNGPYRVAWHVVSR